ncbi:MAG TPA: ATP-grasp domain-containing protein [Myxococcota bacterium]|nr:ATP-grasp domain-containing protein [Myxococcota bacterium]
MSAPVVKRRLLLLVPATTYRTEDFVAAARRLDVEVVVGADHRSTLEAHAPGRFVTLDFADPEATVRAVSTLHAQRPFGAVVAVDDVPVVAAAAVAAALGLRANPVDAVAATRNKHRLREAMRAAGLPTPPTRLFTRTDDPAAAAAAAEAAVGFPCVLKPTILSASRGVIRADDRPSFTAAFARLAALLATPAVQARGAGAEADEILVEGFIPGPEVALEGLLAGGELSVLALFDKPDPLDGPFFEETIYVTPSRLPIDSQRAVARAAADVTRALGLREGPVHAELRLNEGGAWLNPVPKLRPRGAGREPRTKVLGPVLVEIAARSIGGLCARTLRFGTGLTLEEVILRHALGLPVASLAREVAAAGVMMLPIPGRGVLRAVAGVDEARAVPGIVEVTLTAHLGQEVVPLPEGSQYLGFVFSRADTPADAEAALRAAHAKLRFQID